MKRWTICGLAVVLSSATAFAVEIPITNSSERCAWLTIYRLAPSGNGAPESFSRKYMDSYFVGKGKTKKQHWSDGLLGGEVRAEFMTNEKCDHPVLKDISRRVSRRQGWPPSEFVLTGAPGSFSIQVR